MAFDATEALKGGIQGGLTAFPSGNPYLIAGSAAASGLAQGFSKPNKFNARPYRNAMSRLRRNMKRRAARDKREAASQNTTYLNSKGLDGTALGAGIAAGNQRMIDQRTNDYLNQLESDLEFQIADAQTGIDRRWDAQKRQNTMNLGLTGVGLIRDIYTPDSDDTQFLKDLQTKLGLETYDEQQQKQWDQFVEQRKDLNEIGGVNTPTQETPKSNEQNALVPYGPPGPDLDTAIKDAGSADWLRQKEESDRRGIPSWEQQKDEADRRGAKSVTAGDTASIGNLDMNDTVRVTAELMPTGTVVTADSKVPGVVHIEPPGSGVSFTNNSYIGSLHMEHPLGMQELAKHVSGGWRYLLSILNRPMVDGRNLHVIA